LDPTEAADLVDEGWLAEIIRSRFVPTQQQPRRADRERTP
jgi:hypothetical protein